MLSAHNCAREHIRHIRHRRVWRGRHQLVKVNERCRPWILRLPSLLICSRCSVHINGTTRLLYSRTRTSNFNLSTRFSSLVCCFHPCVYSFYDSQLFFRMEGHDSRSENSSRQSNDRRSNSTTKSRMSKSTLSEKGENMQHCSLGVLYSKFSLTKYFFLFR